MTNGNELFEQKIERETERKVISLDEKLKTTLISGFTAGIGIGIYGTVNDNALLQGVGAGVSVANLMCACGVYHNQIADAIVKYFKERIKLAESKNQEPQSKGK